MTSRRTFQLQVVIAWLIIYPILHGAPTIFTMAVSIFCSSVFTYCCAFLMCNWQLHLDVLMPTIKSIWGRSFVRIQNELDCIFVHPNFDRTWLRICTSQYGHHLLFGIQKSPFIRTLNILKGFWLGYLGRSIEKKNVAQIQ